MALAVRPEKIGFRDGAAPAPQARLNALDAQVRDVTFVGEMHRYALEIARSASPKVTAMCGYTFDLPFKSGYFDLVFTVGVLIHIPLDSLHAAMRELARVSGRYLLAVEYFAEQETTIPYRGHNDLLWKRDFLFHFQQCLPGLSLLRKGYWGPEDGFDRDHWWLFEQQKSAG